MHNDPIAADGSDDFVSPYLRRPIRTFAEYMRGRRSPPNLGDGSSASGGGAALHPLPCPTTGISRDTQQR